MKIAILTDENLYNTMRYFSSKLEEELNRQGIETLTLDAAQLTPLDAKKIIQFKPHITLSFNNFQPDENGRFLWDYLKIPHTVMLVDPVIHRQALIKSPYSIIATVDQNDVEFLTALDFHNAFFLPHAIEKDYKTASPESPKKYDIVFLGSGYDSENAQKFWQKTYAPDIIDKIETIVSRVESDKELSFSQALYEMYPEGIHDVDLLYAIDNYLRGKERISLIKSITNHRIHIFGDIGWKRKYSRPWQEILKDQKNVVLHPPVTLKESFEILKQTKISLNSMPFFKKGSHERVFYSLASGALPLSTKSLWMQKELIEDQEILYFDPQNFSYVNEKVEAVLNNEDQRIQMVKEGQKKVLANHTWENRIQVLKQKIPEFLASI